MLFRRAYNPRMRNPLLPLLVLSLVTPAACSKSESPPPGDKSAAPAPAAKAESAPMPAPAAKPVDTSLGSCEVTIEGDAQATGLSGGGGPAIGSDYWYSPEELDKAVETVVQMTVSDKAKQPAALEKAKKEDPKIITLVINCQSERIKVGFLPQWAKYADVPFAPGKYQVQGISMGGKDQKPHFLTSLNLDGDSYEVVGEDGVLDVTRFDKAGAAGTFQFAAQRTDRETKAVKKVTVKGKFDLKCSPPTSICKP
jgi:hypothetical protein